MLGRLAISKSKIMISITLCLAVGLFYMMPTVSLLLRDFMNLLSSQLPGMRRRGFQDASGARGEINLPGQKTSQPPTVLPASEERPNPHRPPRPRGDVEQPNTQGPPRGKKEEISTPSPPTKVDSALSERSHTGKVQDQRPETSSDSRQQTPTGASDSEISPSLWSELWAVATSVS